MCNCDLSWHWQCKGLWFKFHFSNDRQWHCINAPPPQIHPSAMFLQVRVNEIPKTSKHTHPYHQRNFRKTLCLGGWRQALDCLGQWRFQLTKTKGLSDLHLRKEMQYITLRQTLSSKEKEQGYFTLLEKNTRFVREQLPQNIWKETRIYARKRDLKSPWKLQP